MVRLLGRSYRLRDGADVAQGTTTDADTAVTVIGRLKKLVSLLAGGLPAALSAGGGVKVGLVDALPAGTANIGDVDVLTLPALPAGTNNIGDVDVLTLPALPAGTNNIGDVDVLTVPAPLSTTGGGTEATAQRVTIANDSTGVLSVDDNAGSLTGAGGTALPAGTNAIGKLAANSGVDIGDVDVLSAPARAATTDTITAKLATDAIQNGTTALTPKFAIIDAASSGDNTLVAAVSSKKIRVLSLFLVASAAVTVRVESGAGGTALTGQMQLAANGGFVLPFNPVGWFETAATTLLNLELSGAISVDGSLVYVEV